MAANQLITRLRRQLSSAEDFADPFGVLKDIAFVVSENEDEHISSELVLRALENRKRFGRYQSVLSTLARHVGHFPYADPAELCEGDLLAYEFHRPFDLDGETVFHRVQAEVYRYLLDGDNVVLSAPTSFGKSKIIDAMITTGRYSNIVIIVPTLALIDETRRRLSEFRDSYKIITHPSQARGEKNLFVLTAERMLAFDEMPKIDFFVIDEFYKLGHHADGDRMVALNSAFYRLKKNGGQFYLLGPNIEKLPLDTDGQLNARIVVTNFATVLSIQHRMETSGPDLDSLVELCNRLNEPTIIYCASPNRVNVVASALVQSGVGSEVPALLPMADWLSSEYHPEWIMCEAVAQGIGIHHGRLPRSVAQHIVQQFNSEKIKFLICTSTLIEGVNTKAKNIIIYDNKIANRKIDYFTFNNIKGRSGRMFEHFIGHVYLFSDPPKADLPYVDIPLLTQGEDSPSSLLVQIDENDLLPDAKERVQVFLDEGVLPLGIIKENSAISPEMQVSLAKYLRACPESKARMLAWTWMPKYEQLKFTCELIWQYLVPAKYLYGVSSGKQLAYLAWDLQRDNSAASRIIDNLSGSYAAKSVNEAVEKIMQFDRGWAGYELPRMLMALSRIQHYVFSERGLTAGDYSLYSVNLESLFRPPVLGALDEYGIPPTVGEKLMPIIRTEDDLDMALRRLREVDPSVIALDEFEREIFKQVQPSL